MIIVGVDCSTDPRKVGLARAELRDGECALLGASLGRDPDALIQTIADWHADAGSVLLAFDAPLGWPTRLGAVLPGHRAGEAIAEEPDMLFRRGTDRFVRERIGKQSLDVGADRIARTAHSALALLSVVRERTGQTIPLAWSPRLEVPSAAIEVYPAATLQARGVLASGYKKPNNEKERREIVRAIGRWISIPEEVGESVGSNADMLDAAVCVLAGFDFLEGRSFAPPDLDEAKREGWIWVADRDRI